MYAIILIFPSHDLVGVASMAAKLMDFSPQLTEIKAFEYT